jgi:hypothetical protein
MISLVTMISAFGALAALSLRYGVDTRRDDGRKF